MVAVGSLICLAAFNSGNNIFFLVAATLFAMVFIAKTRGLRHLAALEIRGFAPPEGIFANRTGRLVVRATCPRGTMSFRIAHPALEEDAAGVATPEGEESRVSVQPPRRGLWRLEGLRASSVAPYGITRQRRKVRLSHEVVVFPEPAEDLDLARLLKIRLASVDAVTTPASGAGTDFLALREYHPEDGLRRIHWRGLAKTGELYSKVYERDDQTALVLHLERHLPDTGPAWLDRFELAVSRATAAIVQAHQQGRTFALSMAGHPTVAGRGLAHRNRALGALATVTPLFGDAPPERVARGSVVFSARGTS